MARLLRAAPICSVSAAAAAALLLAALLLVSPLPEVAAFIPPAAPGGGSSKPSAPAPASTTKLDVARLDLYPGLKGLFDMSNIILEEVRAGGKEAKQDINELRDMFNIKKPASATTAAAAEERVVHPLYGELVKDLVYKKVYCTSVEKLIAIPIWEQQRIFRRERAQLLAADIKEKLKAGQPLTLPGVITVYEMGEQRGLLDGQHRVGALRMLAESDVLLDSAHLILVEVFPVRREEDIKRLFVEINTAQPVSIIDMPDMADAGEKAIINEAAEALRLAYPAMFKASTNCRLPHVNIDNLRDAIFKANVVGRTGMGSAAQLVEWVKAKNDLIARKSDAEWRESYRGRNADTVGKAVEKARANGFFLGLEPNWPEYEGAEGEA